MNYFLNEFKNNEQIIITDHKIYIRPWSIAEHNPLPILIKNAVDSGTRDIEINILTPEEFEIGNNFEIMFDKKLRKQLKTQNIKINFIFGSQDLDFYQQACFLYHYPKHNMFVHLWPTYWFSNTLKYVNYKHLTLDKRNNIKYIYCTLNNVGKYHRCLLIDLLFNNNLINQGAISWHDFCVDSNYYWKSNRVKPSKMLLSDSEDYFKDNYNRQFSPPLEFFQSFMSVVSETTDRTIFITEKTSMVLLLKQPFLIQGSLGFHNYLKSLGFELYTEIFDYSFDFEPDIQKRTEMIVNNIKSILTSDLNQLYDLIKPKLEYNQKKFFEIANDKTQYPSIIFNDLILKSQYNFDKK